MARPELEDYPDGALTVAERKKLRRLIEEDDRAHWFWSSARTWIIWVGAVATAMTATKLWLIDFLKGLLK